MTDRTVIEKKKLNLDYELIYLSKNNPFSKAFIIYKLRIFIVFMQLLKTLNVIFTVF